MSISATIAKHLREVYFGTNWTWVNMKESLEGLNREEALIQYKGLNSIALLVFHCDYYVSAVRRVLEGKPIDSHHKYSLILPPIETEADWQKLVSDSYSNMETVASLIEQFPDERLNDLFVEEKYGSYYRNFHGIIEHAHYHLGQIVLIRKLIQQAE